MSSELTLEERLALLVDREATERQNRRLTNRLRSADLRQNAVVEPFGLVMIEAMACGTPVNNVYNSLIVIKPIVDPRAGHGPGIGGFKADSKMAWR